MRLRNSSADGSDGSQLFEDTSRAAPASHAGFRWELSLDIKLSGTVQQTAFYTHPVLILQLYKVYIFMKDKDRILSIYILLFHFLGLHFVSLESFASSPNNRCDNM